MNDQPLASVAIVTYNHKSYISQAISCALVQRTDFPFEIVVGEDCSTDGTREIVLEFREKYPEIIRVVTSDTNVGMMKNFLRTIDACIGKYIAFCEGDDFWHDPEKLQVQVDFLENHPDYGMIHSDYDSLNEETNSIERSVFANRLIVHDGESEIHFEVIAGNYMFRTATVCARKDLLKRIIQEDPELFDERFRLADTQLVVGLGARSKVKYLDSSLATYRIVAESATHSRRSSHKIAFNDSRRAVLQLLARKHGVAPSELRRKDVWYSYWSGDRAAVLEAIDDATDSKEPFWWGYYIFYLGSKYRGLDFFIRPLMRLRLIIKRRVFGYGASRK